MSKHYKAPSFYTQADVMKRLKLGRDYNTFYRKFYQYYKLFKKNETK